VNLIVGWCGQFLIFVVLHQFSQVVGEWLENQILIPDWTYFYCPGTTLPSRGGRKIKYFLCPARPNSGTPNEANVGWQMNRPASEKKRGRKNLDPTNDKS